ncbi:MAG TPA: DoxX family protein [Ktedonobacterales bacterium]
MSFDLALLVLRILVGLVLASHGSQKLLGWFGGPGLTRASGSMEKLGFRPGRFWALLASGSEFGGGLLVALGLLTPLAAAGLVAAMLVAITKAHWKAGFWNSKGGFEYPLVLLVVSAVIGLSGAHGYSLDALLERVGFTLPAVPAFLVVLVLALIVIGIGIISGNSQRRSEAHRTA